jgi:hypothetical protein
MPTKDLDRRIECIERANRRWKIAALLLAVGCLVLSLTAFDFPQPNVMTARSVEAQSFVLRDAEGQVRARMAISDDSPRLTFFDEHGNTIASLPLKPEIRPAR